MIIFVDYDSNFLAFSVLRRNINILLSPVDMHLEFDLVVDLRFEYEIVEFATDKGV